MAASTAADSVETHIVPDGYVPLDEPASVVPDHTQDVPHPRVLDGVPDPLPEAITPYWPRARTLSRNTVAGWSRSLQLL